MKIRYYLMIVVLVILAFVAYVYSVVDSCFSLDLFGHIFTLPVAVWLGIISASSMLIFALLTSISGIKNIVDKYKENKDYEKIISQISAQACGLVNDHTDFYYDRFKNISNTLKRFNLIAILQSTESKVEKIDKLLQLYKEVEEGKVVEFKKYGLSEENSYFQTNIKNTINANYKIGIDILRGTFKAKIKEFALIAVLKNGSESEIKKAIDIYNKSINTNEKAKDMGVGEFDKSINFIFNNSHLVFTYAILQAILQAMIEGRIKEANAIDYLLLASNSNITYKEYIDLAKFAKTIEPDIKLNIFSRLSEGNQSAKGAYIYTLLDLEMYDKAKEVIKDLDDVNLVPLKAYIALRDMGKRYPIDIFVK